ncbi:MAG: DUF3299 domain-containing protein [Pseudomonadota bacterium]
MKRRSVLKTLAASPLAALPGLARASETVDIEWADLIPAGNTGVLMERLRDLSGVIQHGELTTGFDQPEARAVTDEFNGQMVRLPGFIVPLEFDAEGVTYFILAPFVGACIHVPPPPANQLILVTSEKPYDYDGLFDPVEVTGVLNTFAQATVLAEIGYEMEARRVVPYS